ncbi:hypothetical protein ACFL2P_03495 [Candidatus Moduliflexota bacterium]
MKRRKITRSLKSEVLSKIDLNEENLHELAREYQIEPEIIESWARKVRNTPALSINKAEVQKLKTQIERPPRQLNLPPPNQPRPKEKTCVHKIQICKESNSSVRKESKESLDKEKADRLLRYIQSQDYPEPKPSMGWAGYYTYNKKIRKNT